MALSRFEGKFGIPPSHPIESLLTQALYRIPESVAPQRIEQLTQTIVERVNDAHKRAGATKMLTLAEARTLQLKLARHFEHNGESARIDISTCVDALVESPRFLQSDKGSISKLFQIHEVKTLQKIAEQRRKRAEVTGHQELNPYEILFETKSGKYYLARLLNMPHLKEESAFMRHCVGTSDSYINKMKRGEVEIFSLRNKETHKPVVTIEYDTKTGNLLQVKAMKDNQPSHNNPFFRELLEAIDELGKTTNDENKPRRIADKTVAYYETIDAILAKNKRKEALNKADLMFLYAIDTDTEVGFNGLKDPRIAELRAKRNPKEDAPIAFDCAPEQIAWKKEDINESTKVYVGPLFVGIFSLLRGIERVYTSFPEGRITRYNIEIGGQTEEQLEAALHRAGFKISDYAIPMIRNGELEIAKKPEQVDLVRVTVCDLFWDQNNHTRDDVYKKAYQLGLQLCPAEVGPLLRLKLADQPIGDMLHVTKQITRPDGDPRVFRLVHNNLGLWLDLSWVNGTRDWNPEYELVFRLPK